MPASGAAAVKRKRRWSDVTYPWSQCDRHFVCQNAVLCVVKWWRFVALFEYNWISWFKKMSVLSLSYWESDVYWRQNNKHLAELALQNGRKQLIWRNYVTVTLCCDFGRSKAITGNRCKIGGKLVLITNGESYMSFPLIPKSVTLNELVITT